MIMERKRHDSIKEEERTVKRRRTAILDAFQSISLNTRELPQREESMSTTASSYFDEIVENDDDGDESDDGCNDPLLSDREEVERQVMLDLAFGRPTGTRRHPVDEKVEEWIRRDYLMRQQFERYIAPSTPHQDDMHLDHGIVYREQSASFSSPTNIFPQIQRSQSLSNLKEAVEDKMDVDMDD